MPVQCFTTSLGACPSMMSHDADLRYSSLAQKLLLQATCSPCSPQWLFLTPPHPQVSHCPSQQMTCPLTAPPSPNMPWVTKMENADHEAPFNDFSALGVESKSLNAIIRVPGLSALFIFSSQHASAWTVADALTMRNGQLRPALPSLPSSTPPPSFHTPSSSLSASIPPLDSIHSVCHNYWLWTSL